MYSTQHAFTANLLCAKIDVFAWTSLAVQWLRLHASIVGGEGLIRGWRNKIPHTVWPKKKKKYTPISQEVQSLVGKKANKYKTIKSYKIKIVQTA